MCLHLGVALSKASYKGSEKTMHRVISIEASLHVYVRLGVGSYYRGLVQHVSLTGGRDRQLFIRFPLRCRFHRAATTHCSGPSVSSGFVISVAPSSAANHRVALPHPPSTSVPPLSDRHPRCSLPPTIEV